MRWWIKIKFLIWWKFWTIVGCDIFWSLHDTRNLCSSLIIFVIVKLITLICDTKKTACMPKRILPISTAALYTITVFLSMEVSFNAVKALVMQILLMWFFFCFLEFYLNYQCCLEPVDLPWQWTHEISLSEEGWWRWNDRIMKLTILF